MVLKKILFSVLSMLFIWSCDDGDLQIDSIDFDNVTVQSCPDSTTLFFKINADQALILELPDGLVKNQATVPEGVIRGIPNVVQLSYRIFSENVTQDYFCEDIPPVTPIVETEIQATGGTLRLVTIAVTENDVTTYEHTLTIEDLILVNDNGESIIATNFEFGTVTTN